jgi:hypothetical protein
MTNQEPNWGIINDGATFEALMHAIVSQEDANAHLFGRSGPDSGQDALACGGTHVYQAKYRKNCSMNDMVKCAIDELAKIHKYRQQSHSNSSHWKNVTDWTIVGNFSINPNDATKWETEVESKYKEINVNAHYWSIEILNQKLIEFPHIKIAFFEGENRVFIGLFEARNWLQKNGDDMLKCPFVGREKELEEIVTFAKSENRILPIIGAGGVGKSRLLYEALVRLSDKKWRVLWGLPESMLQSPKWFEQYNDNKNTIVALDSPFDNRLLRIVKEQITSSGKSKWKFLVTSRPEIWNAQKNEIPGQMLNEKVNLSTLNEDDSKKLIRSFDKDRHFDEAWLYSVFKYTKGVPSWLSMFAQFPQTDASRISDGMSVIAQKHVDSYLNSFEGSLRIEAETLLRWIALWDYLPSEESPEENKYHRFLREEGISQLSSLLKHLRENEIGIIKRWKFSERKIGVRPQVVRDQIIKEWLLTNESLTHDGDEIVLKLLSGEIPGSERIIETLSSAIHVSDTDDDTQFQFLTPVFQEAIKIAETGDVISQNKLLPFLQAAGQIDPESSLDVLIKLRECKKESRTIENSSLKNLLEDSDFTSSMPLEDIYKTHYTHSEILAKIPWILFQISNAVSSENCAKRFLLEFKEYANLTEDAIEEKFENGKRPEELLHRFFRESKNRLFLPVAGKIVKKNIANISYWPFVGVLAKSILNPEEEVVETTSRNFISFRRGGIHPKSGAWTLLLEIRELLFNIIAQHSVPELNPKLWYILKNSSSEFLSLQREVKLSDAYKSECRNIRKGNLDRCLRILQKRLGNLEELLAARSLWNWQLKYGKDDAELYGIAEQCEIRFNEAPSTKWKLSDFFDFGKYEEEKKIEANRVAEILRKAQDVRLFEDFFDDVEAFLKIVRNGHRDMADPWPVCILAEILSSQLNDDFTKSTPLNDFLIASMRREYDDSYSPRIWFVTRILQRKMLELKEGKAFSVVWLQKMFNLATKKGFWLHQLYSNAHPKNIGVLSEGEFEFILTHEKEIEEETSIHHLVVTYGTFACVNWPQVRRRLDSIFQRDINALKKNSILMANFLNELHIYNIRYGSPIKTIADAPIPLEWVIQSIIKYNLDAQIFKKHELVHLRDTCGYRMEIIQFVDFLKQRLILSKEIKKPYPEFEIMLHEFDVKSWCLKQSENLNAPSTVEKLKQLFELILSENSRSFLSYLFHLADQKTIFGFIQTEISKQENPNLDTLHWPGRLVGLYGDSSKEWESMAPCILEQSERLRRNERENIYLCLSGEFDRRISWRVPYGEVPKFYYETRDRVKNELSNTLPDSPFLEYRQWKLRIAEDDLKNEEKRITEEEHE